MNNRVLALLALLVAAGIFIGYVHPTWTGSIAETNAAIASDNAALAAANAYKARQAQLVTERDAIDPDNLARLTTFLPDSVDNVGLILDLNALAARSGFALSSIDVSSNSMGQGSAPANGGLSDASISSIGSIDLSLSAVGTYGALARFLDGVERSERLLDVRSLSVTGSNSGVYSYQMTLRIYWLR